LSVIVGVFLEYGVAGRETLDEGIVMDEGRSEGTLMRLLSCMDLFEKLTEVS